MEGPKEEEEEVKCRFSFSIVCSLSYGLPVQLWITIWALLKVEELGTVWI